MLNIKQEKLVFFVPGILGTTLIYKGAGKSRQRISEELWSKDLYKNFSLFAFDSKKLIPRENEENEIEVGEVIDSMKISKLIPLHKNVYKELLDFCTSESGLKLKQNIDFLLFPYDWRLSNSVNAQKFYEFIIKMNPEFKKRIIIIAHSMGGLVSRLMFLYNQTICNCTDLFIQIASPILGSAEAFFTLNNHPTLHELFDEFWKYFHNKNLKLRLDMMYTFQQFPSLYQLIPPKDYSLLIDINGKQYSGLDYVFWPEQSYKYVDEAVEVHKKLKELPNVKTICFYSNRYNTTSSYRLNERLDISYPESQVAGDKTVTVYSATSHTKIDNRIIIENSKSCHLKICHHEKVLDIIKEEFQKI